MEYWSIGYKVSSSFEAYEEGFFSVENQTALVLGSFGMLILLVWLVIIWII